MNLVTAQAAIRYSVLIGICVACFLCCKYVSSKKNLRDEVKKRDLTFVERDKLKKNKTSTFVDMLAQHSSPVDKLIILAMTDYAFTDMAVNMYETSFKRHGITNFLFVGAGQKSCEILITKYSLPCFHYANDSSENVASVFQSPEFNRKMNIRTYMIIEALQAGYTVLHTDTDVVFLQNPLPELKVHWFLCFYWRIGMGMVDVGILELCLRNSYFQWCHLTLRQINEFNSVAWFILFIRKYLPAW